MVRLTRLHICYLRVRAPRRNSWAFAKACHFDERLFSALASSAVRCIDDFNVQDLVNTAWSL